MTPHGFSHLYELFATFSLAYILIDELAENTFLSLISEKILKKYRVIDESFLEVTSKISGYKTSIINVEKLPISSEKLKKAFPEYKRQLDNIDALFTRFTLRIRKRIKRTYSTKIFVFLNGHTLLYCLTMLFFGGLYEEVIGRPITSAELNLCLDYSMFSFCLLSLLFLVIGWCYDKESRSKRGQTGFSSLDEPGEVSTELANSSIISYGYHITIAFFFVNIFLAILAFHNKWFDSILDFKNETCHQVLIISSVFLPLSNFLIYIVKANSRANRCLPEFTQLAEEGKTEYLATLSNIEDFIRACHWDSKGAPIIIKDGPADLSGESGYS